VTIAAGDRNYADIVVYYAQRPTGPDATARLVGGSWHVMAE